MKPDAAFPDGPQHCTVSVPVNVAVQLPLLVKVVLPPAIAVATSTAAPLLPAEVVTTAVRMPVFPTCVIVHVSDVKVDAVTTQDRVVPVESFNKTVGVPMKFVPLIVSDVPFTLIGVVFNVTVGGKAVTALDDDAREPEDDALDELCERLEELDDEEL